MASPHDIFPAAVVAAIKDDPIVLIDLGARGGLDEDLLPLASSVRSIGFEPDADEAKRLDSAAKGPWLEQRVLPYAIGGVRGPATLHVPREPEGASLRRHNEAMIELFGHEGLHRTLREFPTEVLTLDDLDSEAGINCVDYLKIDIEGAELDVLTGGANLAATAKVMKIECAFIEQRLGQPLASDVIAHLASNGFDLIDIRALQRWRRRPLPSHPHTVKFAFPYSHGRVAQADLIFARRFKADAPARDVAAAMLILSAIGHVDMSVSLLRQCPHADAWWRDRNVDIEAVLAQVSRRMGRQAVADAIKAQLRGLVPLMKSRMGRLAFRPPEHEY